MKKEINASWEEDHKKLRYLNKLLEVRQNMTLKKEKKNN